MYFDPLSFCVYLHMDRKELSSETLKEVFKGLEHLLGKHEDLTLIFSSHIKSWNSVQACNPSTEDGNYGWGCRDRQIPRAHWPASSKQRAPSSVRDHFQNPEGGKKEKKTFDVELWPPHGTHRVMCTPFVQNHTCTTYTQLPAHAKTNKNKQVHTKESKASKGCG